MAFVHGNMLERKGVKSRELLHSTDWYPTLIKLAGKIQVQQGTFLSQQILKYNNIPRNFDVVPHYLMTKSLFFVC